MPQHRRGVLEPPSETARERVLYQYYQPSSVAPDHIPRSSSDTTLSAFAQLVTLRLNTRRALISLIDRSNQYILAEATQALSLQSDSLHNPQGELWFGRTTLSRSRGLCEEALKIAPASTTRKLLPLVVSDLTRDDRFKDRPFVASRPSLRFYAAVPISTQEGFNIGSLCVLDEKPRDGLSDVEMEILADMAIAIMDHLEEGRVKEEHRRSEKMVKGLGLFVEGGSALHKWWLEARHDETWRRRGSNDGADGRSIVDSGPQPDSGPNSASEEHISASKAARAKAAVQFESPEPVVESQPPVATQGDCDDTSAPPKLGDERTLSTPTAASTVTAVQRQEVPPIKSKRDDKRSANSNRSPKASTADLQEFMLSDNVKRMFSRASNIIRECIEVDGTIFLDASIGTFGGHTGESRAGLGRSEERGKQSQGFATSSSEEEHWETYASDSEIPGGGSVGRYVGQLPRSLSTDPAEQTKKMCGILGFSTAESCSLEGDDPSDSYVPVGEAFLQRLLYKYRRGHVFNLSESYSTIPSTSDDRDPVGNVALAQSRSSEKPLRTRIRRESAKETEAKALLRMLPGARSVVLFPLWDSHRERWFAGSFAWTTRSTRVLTRAGDQSFLAAFGNSIMAEVNRLDTIAADRAKSDFISSISHELRSPLHGILASAEFLQDTALDLFQNSMIDTIERCGRTLLDTIQHVLDFAKINNFAKPKNNIRQDEDPSEQRPGSRRVDLGVDIDVSVITEDVIDAVYAGHEFQDNSSLEVSDEASGFPSEGLRRNVVNTLDTIPNNTPLYPTSKKGQLAIILDIGWRSNWAFNTQSGALRRVLMNLFGNALKYTDSGWVKISLQSEDVVSIQSQSQQSIITITVSDSGRGISQEFLHSQLFTPFSQENSLNPGTGLGLSIVLQIVRTLGGTIDVQSELGVGTEVKVSLTLDKALIVPQFLASDAKYESSAMNVRMKTSGLSLGLVGFQNAPSGTSATHASTPGFKPESLSLQSSLKSMATAWFDMKVTTSESWTATPPDIYVADENLDLHGQFGGAPIIVLCSNASLYRSYVQRTRQRTEGSDNGLVHFVSKPCGPHKLAKAIAFCLTIASHPPSHHGLKLSTLGSLSARLASPQSLFEISPDSSLHLGELHSRSEYFPTGVGPTPGQPSEANESSALPIFDKKATNRKPMLLLVDDNHINLKLLETFMKKNNYKHDTAENGLLALQAFQNTQYLYDIIFMDISMPVMNGIDSTRAIRKVESERGQRPATIIALTGLGSSSIRQEAFSSGINNFLTKPVGFNQLREILNNWTPNMEA
ncbi:hypothetical protein OIDMADRAFT_177547 [Oidiodendron maius Zn]|uniref:histidine kinase n=1 Tax=Oidiodendron maius (strain Zn) TaxID=913774 RepID=A0A0C3D241_OIDMZ|nr:hypothetical protein OIDMADRAFT_177547 [Oidiodendron maius Zn]